MQRKPLTKFNIHHTRNSRECEMRRNLPQSNKGYLWKTHYQHHSELRRAWNSSTELRNQTKAHPVARATRKEGIKGMWIGKEEGKVPLFADGITSCIRDPPNSARKFLEMMNKSISVSGYRIDLHKSIHHQCTCT